MYKKATMFIKTEYLQKPYNKQKIEINCYVKFNKSFTNLTTLSNILWLNYKHW